MLFHPHLFTGWECFVMLKDNAVRKHLLQNASQREFGIVEDVRSQSDWSISSSSDRITTELDRDRLSLEREQIAWTVRMFFRWWRLPAAGSQKHTADQNQ